MRFSCHAHIALYIQAAKTMAQFDEFLDLSEQDRKETFEKFVRRQKVSRSSSSMFNSMQLSLFISLSGQDS
jgi:hypothetical protein